jgi:hypothetical protein
MSATSFHIFLPSSSSLFFLKKRPALCLDMVSSGGLSRIPGSRHLGTFGTLLGSLPERQLYLSSDAPQILTVLSSLPLASHLASGLHVTALTQLKAFKSYVLFPLQKKNSLRTTDLLCKHDGNAMETRLREISGDKEFWRSLKIMCIMLRRQSLRPTSVRRTDRLESTRNPKRFFSPEN